MCLKVFGFLCGGIELSCTYFIYAGKIHKKYIQKKINEEEKVTVKPEQTRVRTYFNFHLLIIIFCSTQFEFSVFQGN